MRIFVTGATGFVGFAVVRELLANGHRVLGLTRSEEGAAALAAAGAEVGPGSLRDLDTFRRGAGGGERRGGVCGRGPEAGARRASGRCRTTGRHGRSVRAGKNFDGTVGKEGGRSSCDYTVPKIRAFRTPRRLLMPMITPCLWFDG